MDWNNRFNFGGVTVTFFTFKIAREANEKKGGPNPGNSINLHKFTWFRNCAELVKAGNRWKKRKQERSTSLFGKGFGSNRGYGCTSKIATVCFAYSNPTGQSLGLSILFPSSSPRIIWGILSNNDWIFSPDGFSSVGEDLLFHPLIYFGQQVWWTRLGSPPNSGNFPREVSKSLKYILDSAGRVFVGGTSGSSSWILQASSKSMNITPLYPGWSTMSVEKQQVAVVLLERPSSRRRTTLRCSSPRTTSISLSQYERVGTMGTLGPPITEAHSRCW